MYVLLLKKHGDPALIRDRRDIALKLNGSGYEVVHAVRAGGFLRTHVRQV